MGNLDVLGHNGLYIRIRQEKNNQNDELFFLGFEKVSKMQASVIGHGHGKITYSHFKYTNTVFSGEYNT